MIVDIVTMIGSWFNSSVILSRWGIGGHDIEYVEYTSPCLQRGQFSPMKDLFHYPWIAENTNILSYSLKAIKYVTG